MPRCVVIDAIPASIVFTDRAGSLASLTTYTFAGLAIGSVTATRRIVVSVQATTAALAAISVTVGGISATEVTGCSGYQSGEGWTIRMFIAEVPTGTTASIVVTVTGGATGCRLGAWALYDLLSSVPTASAVDVTDPVSMAVNVDAGGVAVAFAVSRFAMTWTGLTEDFDAVVASGQISGASLSFEAAQVPLTVTCSKTAGGSATFVANTASFR